VKVTIEIDCSPEEARRAMGLPDVAALGEAYLAQLASMGEGGLKPELADALAKGWAPMGEAGLSLWRALTAIASSPTQDKPR
jgi:hypothetical protein